MLHDDTGSVTVEAALSLSVLVTVAAAVVGGVATMAAYIAAVDTAGAAARSHAIGVDFAPPRDGVVVEVSEAEGMVTVTATVKAPLRSMSASAVYPVEFR